MSSINTKKCQLLSENVDKFAVIKKKKKPVLL